MNTHTRSQSWERYSHVESGSVKDSVRLCCRVWPAEEGPRVGLQGHEVTGASRPSVLASEAPPGAQRLVSAADTGQEGEVGLSPPGTGPGPSFSELGAQPPLQTTEGSQDLDSTV